MHSRKGGQVRRKRPLAALPVRYVEVDAHHPGGNAVLAAAFEIDAALRVSPTNGSAGQQDPTLAREKTIRMGVQSCRDGTLCNFAVVGVDPLDCLIERTVFPRFQSPDWLVLVIPEELPCLWMKLEGADLRGVQSHTEPLFAFA